MRLAIISDIHSNLEALTACRQRALKRGAERFVCLGDFVNYGASPAAVMEMCMKLPGLVAVRGNHDDGLFEDMGPDVHDAIKAAIAWTRRQLSGEQLAYLAGLPYVRSTHGVTFAHASAADPRQWEYIMTPGQVERCMAAAPEPITFVGHVHIPYACTQTAEGEILELDPQGDDPIVLAPQQRYVINVGAVGQPRDRNPAACFVVYDSVSRELNYERVDYDYAAAAQRIREAPLDPFFADRLAIGV